MLSERRDLYTYTRTTHATRTPDTKTRRRQDRHDRQQSDERPAAAKPHKNNIPTASKRPRQTPEGRAVGRAARSQARSRARREQSDRGRAKGPEQPRQRDRRRANSEPKGVGPRQRGRSKAPAEAARRAIRSAQRQKETWSREAAAKGASGGREATPRRPEQFLRSTAEGEHRTGPRADEARSRGGPTDTSGGGQPQSGRGCKAEPTKRDPQRRL